MQRIHHPLFWGVLILVLLAGGVLALAGQAPSGQLPPGFTALLPQGYELQSPRAYAVPAAGNVSCVASKQYKGRHSVHEYQCVYFGLMSSSGVIKKYKLAVDGVENREVADEWAGKVAEQVEKTSIRDLPAMK